MSQARFTLTANCLHRTGSGCWDRANCLGKLSCLTSFWQLLAVMIPFDPFRLAYFSLWLKSHQPKITIHAEIGKSHVASNFAYDCYYICTKSHKAIVSVSAVLPYAAPPAGLA